MLAVHGALQSLSRSLERFIFRQCVSSDGYVRTEYFISVFSVFQDCQKKCRLRRQKGLIKMLQ
jgi:hypothetical protein